MYQREPGSYNTVVLVVQIILGLILASLVVTGLVGLVRAC